MDSDYVDQVRHKQAISELLFAYCAYLDRMDLDALADLFTEDCQVDYGPEERMHSRGSRQLRHDLERMWRWQRTSHHLSNVNRPGYSGDFPAWERGWNHGQETGRTDEVSV